MLKINLLPAYIYEKRKVRRAAIAFGLLFVLVLAGMFTWFTMLNKKQQELEMQVYQMETLAYEVTLLRHQVQAEQARAPEIERRVSFIEAVMDYNLKMPKLYEELAKYTYSRILYRSIQPSGNQLTIQAHARTLGDCGRYLLNMYRATHMFNSVAISAVPGWAGSAPTGFDFTVTCGLVNPIVAPSFQPQADMSGAAGTPGYGQTPSPGAPTAGTAPPPSESPRDGRGARRGAELDDI